MRQKLKLKSQGGLKIKINNAGLIFFEIKHELNVDLSNKHKDNYLT